VNWIRDPYTDALGRHRSSGRLCSAGATVLRLAIPWTDWGGHVVMEARYPHRISKILPVYFVRVPYSLRPDRPHPRVERDARTGINAINLVDRKPHGYRIGPGDWTVPSSFCATGGPAAWLSDGFPMAPEKKRPWRNGRQAPQLVQNEWAGYRDLAAVEVYS
jgi:hypothetical protein